MKVALCLAVLGLVAVTVQGESCHQFDISGCKSTTCSGALNVVICEHDECTCGPPCGDANDCSHCPASPDPNHHGHDTAHCVDGGCVCTFQHPGPDGGPGGPGQHHGGP